jgi:hypothetical protein
MELIQYDDFLRKLVQDGERVEHGKRAVVDDSTLRLSA